MFSIVIIGCILHVVAVNAESSYHGQRLDRAPFFTTNPLVANYREGSAVTLSCAAKARPAPKIEWYFGEARIRSSKKYMIKENVTDSSIEAALTIFPFQRNDVGR
ncbi:hypothetical protein AB6A40_008066 [Gnathostoma spinigerum]|uniref:Ig-like domain-containing protein n=1 Tax=Gnathostoma spinigerum TaxID=75299 RepID=A0ABD6EQC0_9BILA